jgi:hypothetical protein
MFPLVDEVDDVTVQQIAERLAGEAEIHDR